MKKFIYLAAAAFALVACNSEEIPTVPTGDVALQVNAAISKTATRAAGTSWAENDPIGITTTTNPATATDYTNICYKYVGGEFNAEPTADAIYFQDLLPVTFSAYYPYTGIPDTPAGVVDKTITAADQSTEGTPSPQSQIDYLFASGATASKESPTVHFTGDNAFTHCMSQIAIEFTEGDDVDFDALMTGYTLSGLYMQGSFNTATGEATATTGEADLAIALNNVTTIGGVYTTTPVIVFPQAKTAFRLEVNIKNAATDSAPQTYKATLTIPEVSGQTGLQPGCRYLFPVTVSKTDLIVGTAEIKDWVEQTAGGATAEM